MSKTLFLYLFRDLLRIFLLASGTLAAIMSFGGLLRPLTENGLDARQVGKMLTYLTPAMMAYSLPAAALFATTVTYGRLAADNELTACRAAGISYTTIGMPAVILGLVVAILSLILLCFIVPVFSLKVEQVIYSNLGQVIVNKIERNHQLHFSTERAVRQTTVFAEGAHLLPIDPQHPDTQLVELIGPAIVTTELPNKQSTLSIPKEFYTAESAIVRIHPGGADPINDPGQIKMELVRGAKFPRSFIGSSQVGVETATFGPLPLDNPIRENVKFMDMGELIKLAADPSGSQRVANAVAGFLRRDEAHAFLQEVADEAGGSGHSFETSGQSPETIDVATDGPAPVFRGDELVFSSPGAAKSIRLQVVQNQQVILTAQAREMHVTARPDDVADLITATFDLYDVIVRTPDVGMQGEPAQLAAWSRSVDVPMDESITKLRQTKTLAAYVSDPSMSAADANFLRREQVVVNNAICGELHGRASFAVSCLILVLVGCALGMMFKSGNFLNAFAVSFVPALLCITLVVAGQQTADHVPDLVEPKFLQHNSPLQLGIALIWSGNAIVLVLAVTLIAKLRRR